MIEEKRRKRIFYTALVLCHRTKPATPPPAVVEAEEVRHNVVVPLPPLDHHSRCLVRLGDTHCSRCHPHRETTLHIGMYYALVHVYALGYDTV